MRGTTLLFLTNFVAIVVVGIYLGIGMLGQYEKVEPVGECRLKHFLKGGVAIVRGDVVHMQHADQRRRHRRLGVGADRHLHRLHGTQQDVPQQREPTGHQCPNEPSVRPSFP